MRYGDLFLSMAMAVVGVLLVLDLDDADVIVHSDALLDVPDYAPVTLVEEFNAVPMPIPYFKFNGMVRCPASQPKTSICLRALSP